MKLNYNLTSGSSVENLTEAYTRIYASSTTYKVSIASVVSGHNTTATAWIQKDGTVLAIDEAGVNITGSTAQTMIVGLFAGFSAEVQAGNELSTYTAASFFHTTGTSSVTIGSTSFKVTNWAANTLPETITSCPPGTTTDLSTYKLSVGAPPGTTYQLVTLIEIAGSSTTGGGAPTEFNYSIQLVSFTVG
ncbi:MAG TPA: hypothetical protein VLX56_05815 [Nitrososphaerales archaeon]|nr:hypothetical protein [Nitrososphaerales archaeon]